MTSEFLGFGEIGYFENSVRTNPYNNYAESQIEYLYMNSNVELVEFPTFQIDL